MHTTLTSRRYAHDVPLGRRVIIGQVDSLFDERVVESVLVGTIVLGTIVDDDHDVVACVDMHQVDFFAVICPTAEFHLARLHNYGHFG